jgi:hypothetical protein
MRLFFKRLGSSAKSHFGLKGEIPELSEFLDLDRKIV